MGGGVWVVWGKEPSQKTPLHRREKLAKKFRVHQETPGGPTLGRQKRTSVADSHKWGGCRSRIGMVSAGPRGNRGRKSVQITFGKINPVSTRQASYANFYMRHREWIPLPKSSLSKVSGRLLKKKGWLKLDP